MKRLGVLVLIGYTASAGVADAATYYVSKSGSNSNTCTQAQNVNTAKLTIVAGIACMTAGGDTLLIRAGTYDEHITSVASGSSWSNKVRIANYNGETVWISNTTGMSAVRLSAGQYIEFDGINMRHTTWGDVFTVLSGAHHIRYQNASVESLKSPPGGGGGAIYTQTDGNEFINLDVSGPGGPIGMYIDGGNGTLVDRLNMHNVTTGGIQAYSDDRPSPTNVVIRNTRISNITQSYFGGKPDNRTFGILISGNTNQVYNNLLYDLDLPGAKSGEAAIVIYTGTGNKVYNNTVTNNGATGGIKIDSGASSTEVKNNIAWNNIGSALQNNGSNTQQSNNLFGIDPLFANPSSKDFQLTAPSRAVDAGTSLSEVKADLSGVARPQGPGPDIGAYEFRGQPSTSGPPAPPTGVRIVSN